MIFLWFTWLPKYKEDCKYSAKPWILGTLVVCVFPSLHFKVLSCSFFCEMTVFWCSSIFSSLTIRSCGRVLSQAAPELFLMPNIPDWSAAMVGQAATAWQVQLSRKGKVLLTVSLQRHLRDTQHDPGASFENM